MPEQTFLRLIEDLIEDEDEQEVGGVFEPDDIAIMTSAFDERDPDRVLADLAYLDPIEEVVGAWSRRQAISMDERFCEAMERALAAERAEPGAEQSSAELSHELGFAFGACLDGRCRWAAGLPLPRPPRQQGVSARQCPPYLCFLGAQVRRRFCVGLRQLLVLLRCQHRSACICRMTKGGDDQDFGRGRQLHHVSEGEGPRERQTRGAANQIVMKAGLAVHKPAVAAL
jgi:hypothetical protein